MENLNENAIDCFQLVIENLVIENTQPKSELERV